jgi:Zn-dependent peptidase ImmA (M78 family)
VVGKRRAGVPQRTGNPTVRAFRSSFARSLPQHHGVVARPSPTLASRDIYQLTIAARDEWSAATLRDGDDYLIILNDAHDLQRQNNTLAHEIGHVVLRHEPAQMFVTTDGLMMMSEYNDEHEQEAVWFAGAIRVPREALLKLITSGATNKEASLHFKVSEPLIRMRRNTTGIDVQNARRRGGWIP